MDKKNFCIIVFALFMAIMAISLAQNAQETADINNIFAIVVNNTDLYPAQRVQGVTYWANDSPIAVYLTFHALGTGAAQTFDSNFSINGSVVLDKDFKTSAGAGFHDHWSYYTIVPRGANYSVTNSTNVFTIEWREYPVLSGKNGTLSVNQTFLSNGTEIAALQRNDTYFNSSFFNQSKNFRNDSINDTIIRNYTPHIKVGFFSRDTSLASGTQSITGVGFKPSAIQFYANVDVTSQISWGFDDGAGHAAVSSYFGITPDTFTQSTVSILLWQSTGILYYGSVQSFDNDGFTITWTKTGAKTGTATIYYMAYR